MPEIPNVSWKRLSVEELKHFYINDPKEYSREETDRVVALVHLVEKGAVKAFKKPNGEIFYQFDTVEEILRW